MESMRINVIQQEHLAETPVQNLKVRLVDVAVGLLTEPREMKLPTMREIAIAAGVTPGAAYRHFESQADLFIAVVSQLFAQLEDQLMIAAMRSSDPQVAIGNLIQAYVGWGLRNPGAYQLLFETNDDEQLLISGERPGLHLIEKLATMISANDKPSQEQIQLATRIWVSIHGLVSLRSHKTGMTWTNSVEQEATELLTSLLKP